MMSAPFDRMSTLAGVAVLALCALAGVLMGRLYFRSVWASARALGNAGDRPRALGLTFVRLALLGGALAGVAQAGAVPLLATVGGILVGRGMVLRQVRREAS